MSQKNRTTLKSYFQKGDRPTSEQFADLIDSSLNLTDDGIFDVSGNLGLGHNSPASRLSVNGNLSVSPSNDRAPDGGLYVHGNVGIGAGFTAPVAQLAVKGSVYIGNTANTDPGTNSLMVDGNIHAGGALIVANNQRVETGEVRARDSSGLKLFEANGKGLSVGNGTGDVSIDGSLTLADGKSLVSDKLTARGSSGLELLAADGTDGLIIRDSGNVSISNVNQNSDGHKLFVDGTVHAAGDTRIDGNLTLASQRHVVTGEVRAEDSGNLKLYESSGAHGLMIHNNGNVSIGSGASSAHKLYIEGSLSASGAGSIGGNLTVTGGIQANSLQLGGSEQRTIYVGPHEGNLTDRLELRAPNNKVVVGLAVRKYTVRYLTYQSDNYTFALLYK